MVPSWERLTLTCLRAMSVGCLALNGYAMQRITNTYSCWRRRRSSSSFSDLSAFSSEPPTPPRSDDASDGLGLAGRMLLERDESAAPAGPDDDPMLSRLPVTVLWTPSPTTGLGKTVRLCATTVKQPAARLTASIYHQHIHGGKKTYTIYKKHKYKQYHN